MSPCSKFSKASRSAAPPDARESPKLPATYAWRDRADETRVHAEQLADPEAAGTPILPQKPRLKRQIFAGPCRGGLTAPRHDRVKKAWLERRILERHTCARRRGTAGTSERRRIARVRLLDPVPGNRRPSGSTCGVVRLTADDVAGTVTLGRRPPLMVEWPPPLPRGAGSSSAAAADRCSCSTKKRGRQPGDPIRDDDLVRQPAPSRQ